MPQQGGNRNNLDGGGGGGGSGPPGPPKPPAGKVPGGSPGLLTSTGGLFGIGGQLLIPYSDLRTKRFYIALIDPNNFDSEEDSQYFFPEEDVQPGKRIDVHKLEVEYRNIGVGKVSFGVTGYVPDPKDPTKPGTFTQKTKEVTLGTAKPDGKLYTIFVNLIISVIRPQAFLFRKFNSGPCAVTRVMMIGNSDEKDFM